MALFCKEIIILLFIFFFSPQSILLCTNKHLPCLAIVYSIFFSPSFGRHSVLWFSVPCIECWAFLITVLQKIFLWNDYDLDLLQYTISFFFVNSRIIGTVVCGWELSGPLLCMKFALFKTSWQIFKMVLCFF